MVLVLCIGDLHIPHRAQDLPPKFKELLKPGKIQTILCSGNVCSKAFVNNYLRTISSELKMTQGDFDDRTDYPDTMVLNIAGFKVGLCHGHQVVPWGDTEALAIVQRQLDVDIMVTGHTHEFKAVKYEDRLLINPGSATGACSALTKDVRPSFVLMDLDNGKASVYVYQLVNGEVKVEKIEYSKPEVPTPAS